MDLKKELQRLARNHCATFNTGTKENCLLETGADTTCHYFRAGDNRCWYFETHVLPAFPEVEEIYMRQVAGVDTDVNYGECGYCGEMFAKSSNKQKYCPACRDKVKKIQNRDRLRRYRQQQG
jgi:hypothetical protein